MAKEIPLIKKIFDPKMFFYDVLKWSVALLVFLDLRLKMIFLTKEKRKIFQGKYLISANHSSFEDPVIISATFWRRRVLLTTKPMVRPTSILPLLTAIPTRRALCRAC